MVREIGLKYTITRILDRCRVQCPGWLVVHCSADRLVHGLGTDEDRHRDVERTGGTDVQGHCGGGRLVGQFRDQIEVAIPERVVEGLERAGSMSEQLRYQRSIP